MRAASVKRRRTPSTCRESRSAFTLLILSICFCLTLVLSMRRTSKLDSSCLSLYLLTPTMTSAPESILAYRRAADSSMRSLGIPETMALVMPPISSTSLMIARASSASC